MLKCLFFAISYWFLQKFACCTDRGGASPEEESKADFARRHWTTAFRNAGNIAGTDKTGAHHYEFIYGKYFAHDTMHLVGEKKFRILEIGLGCNMVYGAGKSVDLWKSWFKNHLDLHAMEYNSLCVEKWRGTLKNAAGSWLLAIRCKTQIS